MGGGTFKIPKRLVGATSVLKIELKPWWVIEPEPVQASELELEAIALQIELELMGFTA